MKPQKYKSVSLAITTVYSLVFHAVVLGSVLTMPIYGGEGYIESYLVYLQEPKIEASKEQGMSPEAEVRKEPAPLPEKKPLAKALRDTPKAPESEKVSRAPKTPEKKMPVRPERQRKTKKTAHKKKSPIETIKEPEPVRVEKSAVPKTEPLKPERRIDPLPKAVEETPVRMVRRVEKPVVKKEPLIQANEKPVAEGADEKASAVPAERKPEDGSREVFDRPGWQESVKQAEPAKKELIRDVEETEPVLVVPQGVLLSMIYENPAEEIIRQQEPAVPAVPAEIETQDSFPSEVEVCEDCTIVSKLYINTPFDIAEDFEDSPRVTERQEPQDGFLPPEIVCEDCDVVSSEYENPARDIMDYQVEQEAPFGLMPGEADGTDAASKLDLLCIGCFMVAMLDENPAEGIIYDHGPGEQVRAVGGFLSAIDEFCSGCARPFESDGGVKYEMWDSYESETAEPAEVTAPAQEETTIKPVVIEVSDAELARSTPEPSVMVGDSEFDIIADSDKVDLVAEILTPTDNRTPSAEDYLVALDEDLKRVGEPEPSKEKSEGEGLGLPLYSPRDMEIRVFFDGSGEGVSFRLMRRPHPMTGAGGKATEIAGEGEEMIITDGSGLRRIFLLARAEKGVYIYIIENNGSEALNLDVSFLLYGGLGQERAREYDGLSLMRGGSLEIKFLMPEAVFWDDGDYFTGEIEGPNSITKFNDETGLIWKEKSGGY